MPCFNTHWLVAMKCIESGGLPECVTDGFNKYKKASQLFSDALKNKIDQVINPDTFKTFISTLLKGTLDNYDEKLTNTANHDDVTCFSAYMLGACGPDFWTVTSKPQKKTGNYGGLKPDTAGIHFDLGHYNRTHAQFQAAIRRWRDNPTLSAFQKNVEKAYFYGMATHIAADCVIHQLVNVSAGAYHLLVKDNWENEHGLLTKNLWNTHNKVENFWDSYIRFRYLGDRGPVLKSSGGTYHDKDPWKNVSPLGFPLTETLIRRLEARIVRLEASFNETGDINEKFRIKQEIEAKKKLIVTFNQVDMKARMDMALVFPRIFCDRIAANVQMNAEKKNGGNSRPETGVNKLKPFIYDIVVKKDGGAYPGYIEEKTGKLHGILFAEAVHEAQSYQMEAGPDAKGNMQFSEIKKLAYFNTATNRSNIDEYSFNYLNYIVCPNLSVVESSGYNLFYNLDTLGTFITSAVTVGETFIRALKNAITANAPGNLGVLGYFWNLDTGLGLKVKSPDSDTTREAITELKFIHISEAVPHVYHNHTRNPDYLSRISPLTDRKYNTDKEGKQKTEKSLRAFHTYKGKAFTSIGDVMEENEKKFMDRINLIPPEPRRDPVCSIQTFFSDAKQTSSYIVNAATTEKGMQKETVVKASAVRHRLNLSITAAIPSLGNSAYEGGLGFYLWNDGKIKLTEGNIAADGDIKDAYGWMRDKVSKTLDYIPVDNLLGKTRDNPEKDRFSFKGNLCLFTTHLLFNLENNKTFKREIAAGKWNNVIPYEPNKKNYSRNYCVGTGRQNVLFPVNSGNFNPRTHFGRIPNVAPTEQIFFTLYLLVRSVTRKPGSQESVVSWFDMVSREAVSEKQLETLIRIETLGFTRIVLFYELTAQGVVPLNECFVDGMKVRIA